MPIHLCVVFATSPEKILISCLMGMVSSQPHWQGSNEHFHSFATSDPLSGMVVSSMWANSKSWSDHCCLPACLKSPPRDSPQHRVILSAHDLSKPSCVLEQYEGLEAFHQSASNLLLRHHSQRSDMAMRWPEHLTDTESGEWTSRTTETAPSSVGKEMRV